MNPIKHWNEKRTALLNEADKIIRGGITEKRDLTSNESEKLGALKSQVFECDQQLARAQADLQAAGNEYLRSKGDRMNLEGYSLVRAINQAAAGRLEGLELECSQEIARRGGKAPSGFFVPCDLLTERRAMSVTGSAGVYGGELVGTEVRGLLEALRPVSRVIQAGATLFSGLTSNISLPKQSASSTATWKAENAELDENTPTITQVSLIPNRVGSFIELSNQLLIQSVESVENFIRRDLLGAIGTALDAAAIAGTGLNNQPLGLLASTSGIGDVPGGTDGAAPTWGHICALVGLVAAANADTGSLAFLTNSAVAAKLRSTAKVTGTDSRMLLEGSTLLDLPVHFSNNVPAVLDKGSATGVCSAIIFGDLSNILIGQFGQGVDLIIDRFSKATTGITRVIANSYCDTAIRRPESFAAMRDALTA
jgi:HK97 family phage major capsid protein